MYFFWKHNFVSVFLESCDFVYWYWSSSTGLSLPLFQQWEIEQIEVLKDTLDECWDTKQGSCLIYNAGENEGKYLIKQIIMI